MYRVVTWLHEFVISVLEKYLHLEKMFMTSSLQLRSTIQRALSTLEEKKYNS